MIKFEYEKAIAVDFVSGGSGEGRSRVLVLLMDYYHLRYLILVFKFSYFLLDLEAVVVEITMICITCKKRRKNVPLAFFAKYLNFDFLWKSEWG